MRSTGLRRVRVPAAVFALVLAAAGACAGETLPEAKPTAEQIAAVKADLGEGFIVTVEGPFLVASDLTAAEHRRFAKGTVKACYEAYNRQ